jgi:hypothetical protein
MRQGQRRELLQSEGGLVIDEAGMVDSSAMRAAQVPRERETAPFVRSATHGNGVRL